MESDEWKRVEWKVVASIDDLDITTYSITTESGDQWIMYGLGKLMAEHIVICHNQFIHRAAR